MSRRSVLAVPAVFAAVWAGCGLRKAGLPTRTYVIRTPAGVTVDSGGTGPAGNSRVLLVRPLKLAPAFDSRSFVVRRGESEYVTDAYNAFLTSPGPMLTEAMAAWVRRRGVFGLVTTGGSQVVPTHVLEGDVMELCGDYRDTGVPKAVLAAEIRLLTAVGARGKGASEASPWVWSKTMREEVPIARMEAVALVAGWEAALEKILAGLDFEHLGPS